MFERGLQHRVPDEAMWLNRMVFLETVAGVPGMVRPTSLLSINQPIFNPSINLPSSYYQPISMHRASNVPPCTSCVCM